MNKRPNKNEEVFLKLSYNAFLDIYEEISTDFFWQKDAYYRICKIRDAVLIYSEILDYEPIQSFFVHLKETRPPLEAELSKEYILFIRNILVHFPFFNSWDEITFTKELINWSKPGKSIDSFLLKFSKQDEIKYRMWKEKSKSMLYLSIKFPKNYNSGETIKLKDFMPEKEGILFAFSLMHQVLMSQVESIK